MRMAQDPREIAVPFKNKHGHFEGTGYDTAYRPVLVTIGFAKGRVHLVMTSEDANGVLSQSHIVMLEALALEMGEIVREHFGMEAVKEVMES